MAKIFKKIRLAALIGRGGRLAAIYECAKKNSLIDLALAMSHKKESPGIDAAKKFGIESFYFRLSDWKVNGGSRESYDIELAKILNQTKIDLVIMAGWDLILGNEFFKNFLGQVMNIHPSLCPAFPGVESWKQAFNYGVRYTGATLHFVVDAGVDSGPIILQEVVRVEAGNTVEILEKRIHAEEEKMICEGINLFAKGKLKIMGRKVVIKK